MDSRHTQIESKWMGKDILCEQQKNIYIYIFGDYSNVRHNRLYTTNVTRYKKEHFLVIEGSIHLEDMKFLNIHASNYGAPKCTEQKLIKEGQLIQQHQLELSIPHLQ